MSRLLQNPWFSIIVRVTLGSIFVYSSLPKIADPPAFAQMIWNYNILPSFAVNLLAMILPWLEILAGFALISGVLRRGAALVVAGMLAVFMAALAFNLLRGNPVDCGCFSVGLIQKSKEELLTIMKLDILRDLGMLAMSIQALLAPTTWMNPARAVDAGNEPALRT